MFNEKELKIWRLALDPSATEGERKNAMGLILDLLRKRNFKYDELTSKTQQRHYKPEPKPTHWGTTKMPFGKYKGEMIQDVEMDYLHWVMSWIQSDDGRTQKFGWLVTTIEHYLED